MKHRSPMRKLVEDIAQLSGRFTEYLACLESGQNWHIRIENGSYMPLVIEVIAPNQVSVCHYGEQNGDAMRDPEMTFEQMPNGAWIATSFRNDYMGIDRSMVRRNAETGRITSYTPDSFPAMWVRNIRNQGFVEQVSNQSKLQPVAV